MSSPNYRVEETDAYVELVIPFDDELDFKVYNPSFLAEWTGWEDVDVVLEKTQGGGGLFSSQGQPGQPEQKQKTEELSFPYRYFHHLMHPSQWVFPSSSSSSSSSMSMSSSTKSPLVQWPKSLTWSQLFSTKEEKEEEPTQVSISISKTAQDAWDTTRREVSQTWRSANHLFDEKDSQHDPANDSQHESQHDSQHDLENDPANESRHDSQHDHENDSVNKTQTMASDNDKTPPRQLPSVDDGARIADTATATARQLGQQWRLRVPKREREREREALVGPMAVQTHWFRTLRRLQDLERKAGCRIVAGEFVDVLGTPLYIGDIRPLADGLPQPCEAMLAFLQQPTTKVLPHTFLQRYRDYYLQSLDV